MRTISWFALIGLLLAALAGCAESGSASSDGDRHPVFYGGVSSGGTRP